MLDIGEWFWEVFMISEGAVLNVADNSGASMVRCFRVLGGTRKRYASCGDVVVASVLSALPSSSIKKGDIVKAMIIRTVYKNSRKDGSFIAFSDNAVCVVDDKREPKATRIFGPVSRELRSKGYLKVVSLSPEVV